MQIYSGLHPLGLSASQPVCADTRGVSRTPQPRVEHAGRVSCLGLRAWRRAQGLGQASRCPGRARHQSGRGSECFSSFKCARQASGVFFFCFLFFFSVFPWSRVGQRVVGTKRDAPLLVALCFVTWADISLIWEARLGHIEACPHGLLHWRSPAWPVMALMAFFTPCFCVSLHTARVSYSICKRLILRSPKACLGLWAEEKAGLRHEAEVHPQLCWRRLCARSSSRWTPGTGFPSLPTTTL